MASLIITWGEQIGKYFQLGNRTLAAGRDPAREIQIVNTQASRKHFLIRKNGDHHLVIETNAKNGLLVNGEPCKEKVLQDGDEIQAGRTVLTYYVADWPDRTNAPEQYRKADREFHEDRTLAD